MTETVAAPAPAPLAFAGKVKDRLLKQVRGRPAPAPARPRRPPSPPARAAGGRQGLSLPAGRRRASPPAPGGGEGAREDLRGASVPAVAPGPRPYRTTTRRGKKGD